MYFNQTNKESLFNLEILLINLKDATIPKKRNIIYYNNEF